MCGIAGVYLRDKSAKADLDAMLTTMLDEIEHRGGDATGFVALGNEGVTEWQKAACSADDFNRHRRPVPEGTRTVLGHTRWATQGLPAFVENNHPLRRGSFFVIHNGHVSNDYKLFELAGRTPYGQVDSEAIAARFASLNKLGKAGKVMQEIVGAAAIAAVDEAHPADLILARGHSSPLYVLMTRRYVLWGSTPMTIKAAWEKHIGRLPKKAKIEQLAEGTVYYFVDGKLTRSKFKPYSPPKVAKWESKLVLPYKETSTEVASFGGVTYSDYAPVGGIARSSSDLRLDDMLECDYCGKEFPWNSIEYEKDNDGDTWQFCKNCCGEIDVTKLTYEGEDVWKVNAAILADDEND